MTVALIGGLDRLKNQYESLAEEHGIELRVYSKPKADLQGRISQVDAVVLFTNLVSHQSAREVRKLARSGNVSLICSHNSSLAAARRCFLAAAKAAQD